jgi:hypothetical protein
MYCPGLLSLELRRKRFDFFGYFKRRFEIWGFFKPVEANANEVEGQNNTKQT